MTPETEQSRFYREAKAARSGHPMSVAEAQRPPQPEAVAGTKSA